MKEMFPKLKPTKIKWEGNRMSVVKVQIIQRSKVSFGSAKGAIRSSVGKKVQQT